MKVKDLITALQLFDPNAEVDIATYGPHAKIRKVEPSIIRRGGITIWGLDSEDQERRERAFLK